MNRTRSPFGRSVNADRARAKVRPETTREHRWHRALLHVACQGDQPLSGSTATNPARGHGSERMDQGEAEGAEATDWFGSNVPSGTRKGAPPRWRASEPCLSPALRLMCSPELGSLPRDAHAWLTTPGEAPGASGRAPAGVWVASTLLAFSALGPFPMSRGGRGAKRVGVCRGSGSMCGLAGSLEGCHGLLFDVIETSRHH